MCSVIKPFKFNVFNVFSWYIGSKLLNLKHEEENQECREINVDHCSRTFPLEFSCFRNTITARQRLCFCFPLANLDIAPDVDEPLKRPLHLATCTEVISQETSPTVRYTWCVQFCLLWRAHTQLFLCNRMHNSGRVIIIKEGWGSACSKLWHCVNKQLLDEEAFWLGVKIENVFDLLFFAIKCVQLQVLWLLNKTFCIFYNKCRGSLKPFSFRKWYLITVKSIFSSIQMRFSINFFFKGS